MSTRFVAAMVVGSACVLFILANLPVEWANDKAPIAKWLFDADKFSSGK